MDRLLAPRTGKGQQAVHLIGKLRSVETKSSDPDQPYEGSGCGNSGPPKEGGRGDPKGGNPRFPPLTGIDLIESLPHHAVTEVLATLGRRNWSPVSQRRQARRASGVRRFGSVGDAVLEVLRQSTLERSTVEVRVAVEELLGGRVSTSSVKNSLARRCGRADTPIERVAVGRYRLRESSLERDVARLSDALSQPSRARYRHIHEAEPML